MLKIFIADDSDLVRERLRELISEVEDTEIVGEATNGAETLAALGRLEPDILILDIRMPGGNGIDALEVVKARCPAPVVIMLTAYAYPQYRKKCLEAGAEYFLDKATEFERVAEVLKQLQDDARMSPGGGGAVKEHGGALRSGLLSVEKGNLRTSWRKYADRSRDAEEGKRWKSGNRWTSRCGRASSGFPPP